MTVAALRRKSSGQQCERAEYRRRSRRRRLRPRATIVRQRAKSRSCLSLRRELSSIQFQSGVRSRKQRRMLRPLARRRATLLALRATAAFAPAKEFDLRHRLRITAREIILGLGQCADMELLILLRLAGDLLRDAQRDDDRIVFGSARIEKTNRFEGDALAARKVNDKILAEGQTVYPMAIYVRPAVAAQIFSDDAFKRVVVEPATFRDAPPRIRLFDSCVKRRSIGESD